MKLILALLLAVGLAAAGTAFPGTLPGGLEIMSQDTSGDMGGGIAYYASSDNVTLGIIEAEAMSLPDWQDMAADYNAESTLKKGSVNGIVYYYICEGSEEEIRCFIDTYFKSTYYTVDLSVLDASESATVQEGENIIKALASAKPGVDGKQDGGGSQAPCLPAAALLLVVGAAFAGKGA